MNYISRILFVILCVISVSCMNNKVYKKNDNALIINTDSILKEGYELYYLEKASWVSTDL